MRVTAFAPYPSPGPSTYFRLEQYVTPLAQRGIQLEIQPFLTSADYEQLYSSGPARRLRILLDGLRRRSAALERLDTGAVVVVQRELVPLFGSRFLTRLARARRRIVYDFDDAVYLTGPGSDPFLGLLRSPSRRASALCRAADAVWPGNQELAAFAARVRGSGHAIEVVPTVVDTHVYRPGSARGRLQASVGDHPDREGSAEDVDRSPPVLGWVGSHTSLPYLDSLFPVLVELRRRVAFRLRVVCNHPPDHPPPALNVEYVRWAPEHRVSALLDFDIGLYPVGDDPWTRGKCGLKAIEYGACALPVVCNPVGVLREIVRHRDTGLHAGSGRQWIEGLQRLIENPGLRRDMGVRARSWIEQRYSVDVLVERWVERLRALAGSA